MARMLPCFSGTLLWEDDLPNVFLDQQVHQETSRCKKKQQIPILDTLDVKVHLQLSQHLSDISVNNHLVEQVTALAFDGFSRGNHVLKILLLRKENDWMNSGLRRVRRSSSICGGFTNTTSGGGLSREPLCSTAWTELLLWPRCSFARVGNSFSNQLEAKEKDLRPAVGLLSIELEDSQMVTKNTRQSDDNKRRRGRAGGVHAATQTLVSGDILNGTNLSEQTAAQTVLGFYRQRWLITWRFDPWRREQGLRSL
ncbi:hypothetical protein EYF80_008213 [Liparis tanakae]|uniref:Uncharacterized protein n=1 Tax=Liparis tanakae TaxID=230148 RepID=A0A4Z2IUF2_9TELE|nr:hypothetical protein EYF80_008213 [Liparis tanakae]